MPGIVFDQPLLYPYRCNLFSQILLVELKDAEREQRDHNLSLSTEEKKEGGEKGQSCWVGIRGLHWEADLRTQSAVPSGNQCIKTGRTSVKGQAGLVVGVFNAPQKDCGLSRGAGWKSRRVTAEPAQRDRSIANTKDFGFDNEKNGKTLNSQLILILFNPKKVRNYRLNYSNSNKNKYYQSWFMNWS